MVIFRTMNNICYICLWQWSFTYFVISKICNILVGVKNRMASTGCVCSVVFDLYEPAFYYSNNWVKLSTFQGVKMQLLKPCYEVSSMLQFWVSVKYLILCFKKHTHTYIVGSRGASQPGGSLLGIPLGYKAN